MEERPALLGAFGSRDPEQHATPDGGPVDYFVFEFDAAYELRPDVGERVTAVSETDEWRVVGIYLIC